MREYNLSLAPMEGVSDFPIRLWMQILGAPPQQSTPFLRVTETFPPKGLPLKFAPEGFVKGLDSNRLTVQLMASCPKRFSDLAQEILETFSHVELNCGCPAPRVVGHGAGSSLLREPKIFEDFLLQVGEHIPLEKLSVKIRTGYENNSEYLNLLGVLRQLPLFRLVVHGRSRSQRYLGSADWNLIEEAARTLPYPVIGSGDVLGKASLCQKLEIAPSVSGVMIGRGALRNPWVFWEIRHGKLVFHERMISLTLQLYAHLQKLCVNSDYSWISKVKVFLDDEPVLNKVNKLEALCQEVEGLVQSAFEYKKIPERIFLGRVKLLWNYLRSGLPERYMYTRIQREKTLEDFFRHLDGLNQNEEFFFSEKEHYNWIYGGGKSK